GSHRELVRRKWAAFSRRRGPGRPAGSRCVERSARPGSLILALGAQGATELQEACTASRRCVLSNELRLLPSCRGARPANTKSSFGTAPPLFVTQSHSGSGQLSDH